MTQLASGGLEILVILRIVIVRRARVVVGFGHAQKSFNKLMNWQGLQLLLKAPKKKYVKKLVEYAILVGTSPTAILELAKTPISQDFMADLQLSTEESHQLIIALIDFLGLARKVEFDEAALRNLLTGHLSEELCQILIDITIKLSPEMQVRDLSVVSQADRLADFGWALEMQVASDRGKANIPVVKLDLKIAKNSSVESVLLQLKGTEFSVFFKNLQKMKEQLGQLVAAND